MEQRISYTPQAQLCLARNREFRIEFYYLISLILEFNDYCDIDIKVSMYSSTGDEDDWSRVYVKLNTENKYIQDQLYSSEWYPTLSKTLANVIISGGR